MKICCEPDQTSHDADALIIRFGHDYIRCTGTCLIEHHILDSFISSRSLLGLFCLSFLAIAMQHTSQGVKRCLKKPQNTCPSGRVLLRIRKSCATVNAESQLPAKAQLDSALTASGPTVSPARMNGTGPSSTPKLARKMNSMITVNHSRGQALPSLCPYLQWTRDDSFCVQYCPGGAYRANLLSG